MKKIRSAALSLFVGAVLCCGPAEAGVKEGIDAVNKGDYATALRELAPAAERGNAEAQYRLGIMYEFGRGVAMDKSKAMSLFRKSAAQGNSSAQVELGVIYATGDGIAQDDAKAVEWFRKAAVQGNATAQVDLGLMYAKGTGVRRDDAQAIAWFRKAADQGLPLAQFKMGVAYENGEGVAKDEVLAYTSYAIAARDGNKEYVSHRDELARQLSPAQLREGVLLADAWTPGQPMPVRGAASNAQGVVVAANGVAVPVTRPDKCSATGTMDGEKFAATHCAVSLYGDQHSVAIWFNEDAISPSEVEGFQLSSYADEAKAGKQRTLVRIMFCPGGGGATASPQSVKSIDFSTNNAKSMIAGVQWVVESPKDFRVEKMSGEVKPGSMLSGRIVGARGKTTWNLDFDLKLPAKDAAAGLSCGK
jgi:TPR repeat protein